MKNSITIGIILYAAICILPSCSTSSSFTGNYYKKNEQLLDKIHDRYEKLYLQQPFQLDLKDKELTRIGIELLTDSIRYIYNFTLEDRSFIDTLDKYKLDIREMSLLISDMQQAKATWISKLDYFVNREQKYLVLLSIRNRKLNSLFKSERYFVLAFFNNPQAYDKKGRLLDKDDQKRHRLINGEIFHRLNDQLFYAVMDRYR